MACLYCRGVELEEQARPYPVAAWQSRSTEGTAPPFRIFPCAGEHARLESSANGKKDEAPRSTCERLSRLDARHGTGGGRLSPFGRAATGWRTRSLEVNQRDEGMDRDGGNRCGQLVSEVASASGESRRCAPPPRVPSMTHSLEVQVLYPA